jgi:nicotinamide mononucleotide transporter
MTNIHDIVQVLIANLQNLKPLEIAGVFFGLISVLFERKGNILLFPTGIVSVIIYVFLCFRSKLYADMAINIYYFVVSLYGWHYWLHKSTSGKTVPVTQLSRKEWWNYLFVLIGSFIILFVLLKYFTDSDVPLADSTTTALFFTGMLLLARKKLENWYAWIIGNLISIPLYFYKGLVLTSFQFLIFFFLAISGYFIWKKLMGQEAV